MQQTGLPNTNLPDPARKEVEAALNEGHYEIETDLYLPHVIPISESYLGETGGDPQEDYSTLSTQDVEQHYRAVVTRDGDTNRLELKSAVPTWGSHTLIVENDTDESQTAEVRIERLRNSKIVVDETLSIPADETTQTSSFDHVFGRYRVTVKTDHFSGQDELRVAEHRRLGGTIVLRSTEMDLRPGGVLEPVFCKGVWESRSETE